MHRAPAGQTGRIFRKPAAGGFFIAKLSESIVEMSTLILFNKPYGVLSQFSAQSGRRTLADFIDCPGVYPAGRLDADSEGLLVLTDDGRLQARIADPRHKLAKTYWAQVEGELNESALARLCEGVNLGGYITRRCQARITCEPAGLWPRDPPIRHRAAIPTSWIEIVLQEGKNRQVRRMTACVGHPTLRLIRSAIGPWHIDAVPPGHWCFLDDTQFGNLHLTRTRL